MYILFKGNAHRSSGSGVGIQDDRIEVQVVATKAALTFFAADDVKQASDGRCQTWTDDEEWSVSQELCQAILTSC